MSADQITHKQVSLSKYSKGKPAFAKEKTLRREDAYSRAKRAHLSPYIDLVQLVSLSPDDNDEDNVAAADADGKEANVDEVSVACNKRSKSRTPTASARSSQSEVGESDSAADAEQSDHAPLPIAKQVPIPVRNSATTAKQRREQGRRLNQAKPKWRSRSPRRPPARLTGFVPPAPKRLARNSQWPPARRPVQLTAAPQSRRRSPIRQAAYDRVGARDDISSRAPDAGSIKPDAFPLTAPAWLCLASDRPEGRIQTKLRGKTCTYQNSLVRRGPLTNNDVDRSRGHGVDAARSSREPIQRCCDPKGTTGNLMIANWTVGKEADRNELARLCIESPFDIVVITITEEVTHATSIGSFLQDLNNAVFEHDEVHAVLREKHFNQLSGNIFVLIHRAKVSNVQYQCWSFKDRSGARSRGEQETPAIQFGSLLLQLDTERQAWPCIKVGVIYAPNRGRNDFVSTEETKDLVEWVVTDKLAIVTGFFGNNARLMQDIATQANAVYDQPVAQQLYMKDDHTGEWILCAYPSFFLFFGYYSKLHWPDARQKPVPDDLTFGEDIQKDLVDPWTIRTWFKADEGSASVPFLGRIQMKPPNWNRWISHVVQTCLWIGDAMPSSKKNRRWREPRR